MSELSVKAEEFLDEQAEHLDNLEQLADKNISAYADRYIELLNNPEERNPEIAMNILSYLYVRDVETTGDDKLILDYYSRVDEFLDLSWKQLHFIPLANRGNFWSTAQAVIDIWCSRQARVESGFVSMALNAARTHATERKQEWLDLPKEERERLAEASGVAEKKKAKTKARKKAE